MVESSFIKEITHDRKTNNLDVEMEFKDKYGLRVYKSKYRYLGVPWIVANAFKDANSKGNFYNKRIKDNYASVKIYSIVENAE